ncbi:MAG TPA: hypothetical protein VJP02_29075 [Candidatus Sulfotelmatobacter sp.]|nr:hypothetical protein [Candidatus Sulfotelmatobacter sp.]
MSAEKPKKRKYNHWTKFVSEITLDAEIQKAERSRRMALRFQPIAIFAPLGAILMLAQAQAPKSMHNSTNSVQRQAVQLLDEASAQAGTLQPSSQAGLFFVIGKTYAVIDRAKSRAAYEAAYQNFQASIAADGDKGGIMGFMGGDLIMATVEAAPMAVEHSLPPDQPLRDIALECLVRRYAHQKSWNRAIELLGTMESDERMTSPVRDLLAALSRQDDRDRVFRLVLDAYTQTTHRQVGTGSPDDLGTLLLRYWRKLSPGLVQQAIDELLKQSKDGDGIVMKSPRGTVTFSSYQFRLFQILPVLKTIDPDRANQLLKDETSTAALLATYPEGQLSVDSSLKDTNNAANQLSHVSYSYVHGPISVSSAPARMDLERTADEFIATANKYPDSAIANASRISDSMLRIRVLVEIAQAIATIGPAAAKRALYEALKSPSDQDEGWHVWKEATEVAVQLKDAELAGATLKAGLKAARRVYDDDSNHDNPNEALKLYWPSVRAYRELLTLQFRISPDQALATVTDLPDVEVVSLEKVMLAAAMLNVSLPETSPMVAKKQSSF